VLWMGNCCEPRGGRLTRVLHAVATVLRALCTCCRSGTIKLLPLLLRGSYKESFPEPVLRHFVRDCRDVADYSHVVAGLGSTPGVIPTVTRLQVQSAVYPKHLTKYLLRCVARLPC
jgi:hypothetical protein